MALTFPIPYNPEQDVNLSPSKSPVVSPPWSPNNPSTGSPAPTIHLGTPEPVIDPRLRKVKAYSPVRLNGQATHAMVNRLARRSYPDLPSNMPQTAMPFGWTNTGGQFRSPDSYHSASFASDDSPTLCPAFDLDDGVPTLCKRGSISSLDSIMSPTHSRAPSGTISPADLIPGAAPSSDDHLGSMFSQSVRINSMSTGLQVNWPAVLGSTSSDSSDSSSPYMSAGPSPVHNTFALPGTPLQSVHTTPVGSITPRRAPEFPPASPVTRFEPTTPVRTRGSVRQAVTPSATKFPKTSKRDLPEDTDEDMDCHVSITPGLKPGDQGWKWINYNARDAEYLMSGVAPSGGSRRYRDEDEEPADFDEPESPTKRRPSKAAKTGPKAARKATPAAQKKTAKSKDTAMVEAAAKHSVSSTPKRSRVRAASPAPLHRGRRTVSTRG